jgi:excisionase family DNA binding protein
MRQPCLTLKETADWLCLSERTVYRLARTGQIPGHKFGTQWRFPYREITELLLGRWRGYAERRYKVLEASPTALPSGRSRLERGLRKIYADIALRERHPGHDGLPQRQPATNSTMWTGMELPNRGSSVAYQVVSAEVISNPGPGNEIAGAG